jgi:hypothetical protein
VDKHSLVENLNSCVFPEERRLQIPSGDLKMEDRKKAVQQWLHLFRTETVEIAKLSGPMFISNLCQFGMGIVDTVRISLILISSLMSDLISGFSWSSWR